MKLPNDFNCIPAERFAWIAHAATNGSVYVAFTRHGMELLLKADVINQATMDVFSETVDLPVIVTNEPLLVGSDFADAIRNYPWYSAADFDEEKDTDIRELAEICGVRDSVSGCKTCWEKDGKLVEWKEFYGEVIERCPECHGESLTGVPMKGSSVAVEISARLALFTHKTRAQFAEKI